jgi:hypothetical protein
MAERGQGIDALTNVIQLRTRQRYRRSKGTWPIYTGGYIPAVSRLYFASPTTHDASHCLDNVSHIKGAANHSKSAYVLLSMLLEASGYYLKYLKELYLFETRQ